MPVTDRYQLPKLLPPCCPPSNKTGGTRHRGHATSVTDFYYKPGAGIDAGTYRLPRAASCNRTIFLALAIIISIALSPLPSPGKTGVPSFSKTVERFHQVSQDRSSTRDQWLQVVHSFLAISEAEKPSERGRRSLLLAGKAALDLYRRSGHVADLDEAIKCLNAFNSISRSGPYHIPGLQALKEADLLKRQIHIRLVEKSTAKETHAGPPVKEEQSAPGNGPGIKPPQRDVDASSAGSAVPSLEESGSEGTAPRGSYNCTGNPFFREFSKPSADGSKPVMRASLIPNTVTDVPSARSLNLIKPKQVGTIVIDPGHGGKDPGAVSADSRLKEKEVTLDIAERTKRKIEKELPGTIVSLTRDDDRFVALEDRTAVANATNSDLFLSIHCNADTDSSSNGVETYFLSKADSRKAVAVAARENGIPRSQISDLQATLLDLMITSKKAESVRLAHMVHDSVIGGLSGKVSHYRDRGIKPAPLYILLGARMPAIMVECGFISNQGEKRNLASAEYRDTIAEGIARGAVKYLKALGEQENPGS